MMCEMSGRRRRGTTLIEILVVMAIMVLLSGMVMAAAKLISAQATKQRSATILNLVRNGLEMTAADQGGYPTPVPHPIARSAASRSSFVRGTGEHGGSAGDSVAAIGEALVAASIAAVPAAERSRVLLPSDRFVAGPNGEHWPLAFAASRRELGILGSGAGLIDYRRLPLPETWNSSGGMLAGPYTGAKYPDAQFLVFAPGDAAVRAVHAAAAIAQAIDESSRDELVNLGALITAEDDPGRGDDLLLDGHLVSIEILPAYQPGALRSADGVWHRVRLRGAALYDAWGQPIFFSLSGDGMGMLLTSPGPDGCLAIDPGADGVMETTDPAVTGPEPGDHDGRKDNVVVGNHE